MSRITVPLGNVLLIPEHELVRCCEKWQRLLRLREWWVSIALARKPRMGDSEGLCEYNTERKEAQIALLHPADYPETRVPYDMEATLVHELLHLHFAPFMATDENDAPTRLAQEQALNAISATLVQLARQGRRPPVQHGGDGGEWEEAPQANGARRRTGRRTHHQGQGRHATPDRRTVVP